MGKNKMNREKIIASYYKKRKNISFVKNFCAEYPLYSSKYALKPEFDKLKKKKKNDSPKITKAETLENSMNQTVSFITTLSRISTNNVFYKEIISKRNIHNIFSKLEKENIYEKKWYYIDENNYYINGPFNSLQMDELFKSFKINPKTKIKRKAEDDNYYFLANIIKRYYKRIISKKYNFECKNYSIVSSKFVNFKKGQIVKRIFSNKKKRFELYSTIQRGERTFSLATRPNNIYLKDMLPEDSGEKDNSENFYSRLRAQTLAN